MKIGCMRGGVNEDWVYERRVNEDWVYGRDAILGALRVGTDWGALGSMNEDWVYWVRVKDEDSDEG